MPGERIAALEARLSAIEGKLEENTQLTKDVRDILGTFRIVGIAAKWIGAIGAAGLAIYHGWLFVTGR
jgi:hypothetical protein